MRLFVPTRDLVPSLLSVAALGLFAVAYLALSYGYEPKVRAFPLMIGWTMLVFVAMDVVSHTDTAAGRMVSTIVGRRQEEPESSPGADRSPLFALIWIPAYGVMVYLVGFLITAGVYMFVSMAVFGTTPRQRAAAWSAGFVAVIWLFFEIALGFTLFPGVLIQPFL